MSEGLGFRFVCVERFFSLCEEILRYSPSLDLPLGAGQSLRFIASFFFATTYGSASFKFMLRKKLNSLGLRQLKAHAHSLHQALKPPETQQRLRCKPSTPHPYQSHNSEPWHLLLPPFPPPCPGAFCRAPMERALAPWPRARGGSPWWSPLGAFLFVGVWLGIGPNI